MKITGIGKSLIEMQKVIDFMTMEMNNVCMATDSDHRTSTFMHFIYIQGGVGVVRGSGMYIVPASSPLGEVYHNQTSNHDNATTMLHAY